MKKKANRSGSNTVLGVIVLIFGILLCLLGALLLGYLAGSKSVMPDLQGLSQEEALLQLEELNLEIHVEWEVDEGEAGLVLQQDPKAGSRLYAGDIITLSVSVKEFTGQESLIIYPKAPETPVPTETPTPVKSGDSPYAPDAVPLKPQSNPGTGPDKEPPGGGDTGGDKDDTTNGDTNGSNNGDTDGNNGDTDGNNGDTNGGNNGDTNGGTNGGNNGSTNGSNNGDTNGGNNGGNSGGTNGDANGGNNGGTNGDTNGGNSGGTNGDANGGNSGGTNGDANGGNSGDLASAAPVSES